MIIFLILRMTFKQALTFEKVLKGLEEADEAKSNKGTKKKRSESAI